MNNVIKIIQAAFWNTCKGRADKDVFEVLIKHSIEVLPASILSQLEMPSDLKNEWTKRILRQIVYNTHCKHIQNDLPITVPYVILKGTSAAQYYPHPEYRTLGDIDIMTSREDFDQAYKELVDNGYVVTKELEREIGFLKEGVMVELHRYFASLNDPQKAKYMDDLIIENINPSHILPDTINGLVLIEHINQHLERGLGLRQIIDWMMFVDKCLPNDKWQLFRDHAEKIGMENLAVVITRMCEIYLGLPPRQWCSNANEKLCEQLMGYIMACGNFGNVRAETISIGENVFYWGRTPKALFVLLQERGMANWKAAQKISFCKPFAWIYQLGRYLVEGLKRDEASSKLKREYSLAKQRNRMFEELGVRQVSKRLAVYRDGKYVKRGGSGAAYER